MLSLEKPFVPGQKSQFLEDVTCLAWNRQPTVPHILASGSNNGYTVIWDLRAQRDIIKLQSPTRKPVSSIAWNPDVPTQILTASDDDNAPVIYIWDLRNAHAPEKVCFIASALNNS
jgi:protein transport protein SEC31